MYIVYAKLTYLLLKVLDLESTTITVDVTSTIPSIAVTTITSTSTSTITPAASTTTVFASTTIATDREFKPFLPISDLSR